jgi:hypothetical protein
MMKRKLFFGISIGLIWVIPLGVWGQGKPSTFLSFEGVF